MASKAKDRPTKAFGPGPPQRSPDPVRSNVPEQLNSFVGREGDLAALKKLAKESRLITLTGPGGVGKSRLALQFARSLESDYPDGVCWVDFTSIDNTDQVPATIASSLGLQTQGETSKSIVSLMKDKRALLVLDNCEHVLSGCAHFTREALEQCARLEVIATSQESLGVRGEALWPVTTMTDRDAVELFRQRARLVQPGFVIDASNASQVADICHQVDRLPLAIELAASKLGVMSESEISRQLVASLDMLTGGPRTETPRQQTVAATIDWSYSQLGQDEQSLFRRLAVFRGGFNLDSATAVCKDAQVPDVLPSLTRLVNKSVVAAHRLEDGSTRYRLLELHAAFAVTEIRRSPPEWESVQRRHHDHFVAGLVSRSRKVAGRAAKLGVTLADEKWKRLELGNLWAAFKWAQTNTDERGLNLAPDILLVDNGDIKVARQLLDDLLAESKADISTRLWAMDVSALLAQYQGDFGELDRLCREIEVLARKAKDTEWIAKALNNRGVTYLVLGSLQDAEGSFNEGLPIARATSNPRLIAYLLNGLGNVLMLRGETEAARQHLSECVGLLKPIGDAWLLAGFMDSLALAELACGDHKAAESTWREAMSLTTQFGDFRTAIFCLAGIACAANAGGNHARCLRLASAHHRLAAQWSLTTDATVVERLAECEETSRQTLGEKKSDDARKVGAEMSLDRAIDYARQRDAELPTRPGLLSRREVEVASLVAQGMTNRAIGLKLFLSERTVEGHIDRIRTKLDLRSRSELAAWAARHRDADDSTS